MSGRIGRKKKTAEEIKKEKDSEQAEANEEGDGENVQSKMPLLCCCFGFV